MHRDAFAVCQRISVTVRGAREAAAGVCSFTAIHQQRAVVLLVEARL
jgi:hypothetical protein